MKKFMFTLMAGATLVAGVNAQEGTGGADTNGSGAINGSYIATGLVAAGVIAGIVNNNSANAPVTPPGPTPQPSCEGDDPLDGDVCVGTTITVTVSGTTTITVPVTFTYAPTVQ